MKLFLVSLFPLLVFLFAPAVSFAKMSVFACEPEWAALSKEIGGDRVKTFSATSAKQDPHYIRARPSLISKVRKADLLVCSGAGLEAGWLPILLKKAGSGLQPASAGHLMAADIVKLLEIPVVVDRRMGDIHPEGNSHVHLNPYNLIIVGRSLADRLSSRSTLKTPLSTKAAMEIFPRVFTRRFPDGNPKPLCLKENRLWFITNRLLI